MKARSRSLPVVLLLLIGLAVGWLWVSPSRAVEGLRSAAREGDQAQLSRHVDFPALRENLKTDLKASILGKREAGSDNPLGVLVGSTVINGLVDTFVSPAAIAAVARGYRPDSRRGNRDEDERPYTIKRRRLNSFEVEFDNASPDSPRLVFSRRGLRWQLVRILISK